MRLSASVLLLLMPMVSVAQNYQGMSEADMQNTMQQMQKMQSCMSNVDQESLKALEQRSYQIEAEVKSLCASGKHDEAQETAISMGKEMMSNPAMQEMKKCGEMMQGMVPQMAFMDQDKAFPDKHVCD